MTESEKSPLPPFVKGGAENAPFRKGGRAPRGGIYERDCANLLHLGLEADSSGVANDNEVEVKVGKNTVRPALPMALSGHSLILP